MNTSRRVATGVVVVLAGTLAGTTWAGAASHHRTDAARVTTVDPADFTSPKANTYYPLNPGHVTRLHGTDGGTSYHERVVVTHKTKMIEGVKTHVIHDVLRRADGSLAEQTTDWYAGDNAGNVWYFGESTATYRPNGTLESREGSWKAGVAGARPGVIMPADPRPTDAYRQEFRKAKAEDQAWIVQRNDRVHVPYGALRHVVRSYEWSRLESNVLSLKQYAPGIGIVKERDVAGGSEQFVLVASHD